MKRLILFPICFLVGLFYLAGQTVGKVKEDKYKINLPDYWKPGNKIWQILSDKLPIVCEEIKDKELCGNDCNAKYYFNFYKSSPVVTDYFSNHVSSNNNSDKPTEEWDFLTYFKFECYLLLYDNTDKLLTKVIVIDSSELWHIKNRATLLAFAPPPPSQIQLKTVQIGATNFGEIMNSTDAKGPIGQTPYSYINSNKKKLAPTEKNLLSIIDERIKSL